MVKNELFLDIKKALLANQESAFRLRFQKVLGSVEKTGVFQKNRLERARLLTKMRAERGGCNA